MKSENSWAGPSMSSQPFQKKRIYYFYRISFYLCRKYSKKSLYPFPSGWFNHRISSQGKGLFSKQIKWVLIHTWLRLKSTSNNYPTRKPLTLRLNYHKKVLGHLWEGLSWNVSVKNLFGCLLIDQNVSKNSYFHHR